MVQGVAEDELLRRSHQVVLFLMLPVLHFLALRPDALVHIRVHIGDEKILPPIVVVVEELNAHGTPGGLREVRCFFRKAQARAALKIVIRPHHIEEVEIGKAIAVEVGESCISTPSLRFQANQPGDVSKPAVAEVPVEHRSFEALGVHVPGEGIGQAEVLTLRPFCIGRVTADVANQKVEQPVVVVIDEDASRGVGRQLDSGALRDVAKHAVAIILQQNITAPHGGDKKVGIAVIVNIREGRGNRDPVANSSPRAFRNVAKPPGTQVLPEFVAAHLIHKEEVGEAVAIHVRSCQTIAMIVVDGLVVQPGIVHNVVDKRDTALFHTVCEAKIVVHFKLRGAPLLGLSTSRQRRHALVARGVADFRRSLESTARFAKHGGHHQQHRDRRAKSHLLRL